MGARINFRGGGGASKKKALHIEKRVDKSHHLKKSIEYFIVKLFIEDTQYLSLCCARYILLSIPSIQIQ